MRAKWWRSDISVATTMASLGFVVAGKDEFRGAGGWTLFGCIQDRLDKLLSQ